MSNIDLAALCNPDGYEPFVIDDMAVATDGQGAIFVPRAAAPASLKLIDVIQNNAAPTFRALRYPQSCRAESTAGCVLPAPNG